jgi:cold shock protein
MSNPQPSDQTRYCERCGISFLWSAEEQKEERKSATAQAPSHCPGCRLLLPPAGRERGLVKWYNQRKRYGFLVRRDAPEIFAHGSDIQGAKSLHPGDLVEFSVEAGARGPAAKEIAIIDHTDPPTLD